MKLIKKIKSTFYMPERQDAKIVLLAMRCGFIEGPYKITGFDNFLTRFLWRKYLDFHESEKESIIEYLTNLDRSFKSIEFWDKVKN